MILKDKAIEPKAGSATSVYNAVIINISGSINDNNAFMYLQVFCPDVMSGSINDAKFAGNNWIDAPKHPHDGVDYNYQIGGIVLISYQNGNIDSPQFVRYVPVDENVINENAQYINLGIEPSAISEAFNNILDDSVTLESAGLKKGIALLPALERCNNGPITYIYGYGRPDFWGDNQNLVIYRCGKYNTELIFKDNRSAWSGAPKTTDYNFNYLSEGDTYSFCFLRICMYLLQNYKEKIVEIFNSTIKEIETNIDFVNKDVFSVNNTADILYLYTNLAGYICDPNFDDDSINKSNLLSSEMFKEIKDSDLQTSRSNASSNFFKVFYANGSQITNIYHGYYKGNNSYPNKDLTTNFVWRLWQNIYKDNDLNSALASRYAMILTNYLMSFSATYNSNISNQMLLIITVLSVGFPTLYKILINIDLHKDGSYNLDNDSKDFLVFIKDCLKDSNKINSSNYSTSDELANQFCKIYFKILGWNLEDVDNSDIFNPEFCHPSTKASDNIKNAIKKCIDYIFNNYNSLKEIMESTLDNTTNSSDNSTSSGISNGVSEGNQSTNSYSIDYDNPTQYYNVNLSHDVQDYLFEVCKQYNMSTSLMLGVIKQESDFDPNCVSINKRNGVEVSRDLGLCQLNTKSYPDWIKKLGISNFDPFNPKQNIRVAVFALDAYGVRDVHHMLMCYNMGASAANARRREGIYTSEYSRKVVAYWEQYRSMKK